MRRLRRPFYSIPAGLECCTDLALSYEHADWEKIDRLTGELGIPTNLLTSLYFTCMEEVNRVWIEMNRPVQGQITDDTKIDT